MKIAFTFDDGPNPAATPQLLAVLAEQRVKATFFVIGQWVDKHPELTKQVYDAGHRLGNHTYTHPKLTDLHLNQVSQELSKCDAAIMNATGEASRYFRPPFIITNRAIDDLAESKGLKPVYYQAAGGDGSPKRAVEIFNKVLIELNGGSGIILLHDGSHEGPADRLSTVAATDLLIQRLKLSNAEFVFPEEVDGERA
jgi:peptidoglycan/xylan/chitin deacetylase (PgdA/CDA1 family)